MLATAEFLTPLDLRAADPGEWVVLADLRYRSTKGRIYLVPANFITDLASIPRLLQPFIAKDGNSRRAAVLHDFRYCLKRGTRAEADALFHEALLADGVGTWTARLMWLGVRAGGWVYWNSREGMTLDDVHHEEV